MTMGLRLQIRPYSFVLTRSLRNAAGEWQQRRGWLLRLESPSGRCGWGEVSPLDSVEQQRCARAMTELAGTSSQSLTEADLERHVMVSPGAVAFGLGAALAEVQELLGGAAGESWLPAPSSAQLLPAGSGMPAELERLLAESPAQDHPLTVKWKVAATADAEEWRLLEWLRDSLPRRSKLRLDANGGWCRQTAQRWVETLQGDPRLEWLEQPLMADDLEGHRSLLARVPVALDEGLRKHPAWREHWPGWQVRRPSLEGDPRPLLRQLQQGVPRLMLSTAFETGIGARWLAHLAALQLQGPTPTAPGLAPGWSPQGPLFSSDPEQVWAASEAMA